MGKREKEKGYGVPDMELFGCEKVNDFLSAYSLYFLTNTGLETSKDSSVHDSIDAELSFCNVVKSPTQSIAFLLTTCPSDELLCNLCSMVIPQTLKMRIANFKVSYSL
ncbi:hypothetical protein TNCT_17661 [Trichonephila clavata]|uniref:Uncharacterized protein n=1 Tax=Trichonephila clavata TaxID=2740835 RepID=A0A8X6L478_TRICU|nr:hypothetical protein TNCT_17661 [Trichonephila clavata]